MNKITEYAQHLNADEFVIKWTETTLKKYLTKNKPTTEEMEHIIDFFVSEKPKVSRMSYAEAKVLAEKWNKAQQKKGCKIDETKKDTEVVLDFKDGFKFVKLVGKAAYEREGFLMNHCVASYFGKSVEIFSLRDKDNMPHCTVEKDQQIKGKGNGDIHPKYIDYVVRFLEHSGMAVRDSEMAHLGYETVEFGKYSKTKLYRDTYAPKGTKIEYQDNLKIFDNLNELKNYLGKDIAVFRGSIVVDIKEKLTLPKLEQVSGSVYVRENATLTAPKLEQVSGYVYVRENATLTAPNLKVSGSVYVRENATLTAPKLEQVSGYVGVYEGGKLNAPLLKRNQ